MLLGGQHSYGAITNDYSQPEGDRDRQVLGFAEALLIESCL